MAKKQVKQVACAWAKDEKIWLQVPVADTELYARIKRSHRVRVVAESFRIDGFSDEVVFEMDKEVFEDFCPKMKLLTERAPKGEVKIKKSRVAVDEKLKLKELALAKKGDFQAADLQKKVDMGLASVRTCLRELVLEGKLESFKKGYRVASQASNI